MRKQIIIETPDYILEVSDEQVKEGNCFLHPDNTIERASRDLDGRGVRKIIAHKPQNNAPALDLPLISEIIAEDDVEKFACNIYNLSYEEYLHIREHVSQTRESVEAEYEHLGLEIPNKYFDVISFIVGYNYKSATKVYSEEDLRKAYNTNHYSQEEKEKHWESFKQSLKQPINKVIKTWI